MIEAARPPKTSFNLSWVVVYYNSIYLLLALACLRQWNSSAPWARLDVYSGGFLLLHAVFSIEQIALARGLSRWPGSLEEFLGIKWDAKMMRWYPLLAIAGMSFDLAVFLDYGHLHLLPTVERPILQSAGLGIYSATVLLLMWTDTHLARHFATPVAERKLMTTGPYRYGRHPRYVGLSGARIALALVFTSIIGWIVFVGWVWGMTRRMRLEENHLLALYGSEYESYSERTSRLLPKVY
ncbi:MAG: methyltransferase family protein [Blastocatellia bacterium]